MKSTTKAPKTISIKGVVRSTKAVTNQTTTAPVKQNTSKEEKPLKAYIKPPAIADSGREVKRRIKIYPVKAAQPNFKISNGPIKYGTKLLGKSSVSQKNGLPKR